MEPERWNRAYMPVLLLAAGLVGVNVYFFGYEFFYSVGLTSTATDNLFATLYKSGMFGHEGDPWRTQYLKLAALVLCSLVFSVGSNIQVDVPWPTLLVFTGAGLLMFLFPYVNAFIYVVLSTVGFIASAVGIIYIMRKMRSFSDPTFDVDETFAQGQKHPIENDHSVNFRIRYKFHGRWHKAWAAFPNVYRAFLIFGGPGSGKTYVFINEIIWQLMQKGFSTFVYDFKYPIGLATYTYNCYLRSKDVFVKKYGCEPQFVPINMKDVRYSMRCNPLDRRYIQRISDATNKSIVLSKNVVDEKEKGFFGENREKVWTAAIWFLRCEEDGRFCTFPHFIELITNTDSKDLMRLLMTSEDCRPLVRDIISASEAGASDQAEGIFASASSPLAKLRSHDIYYVFGGNNVDLRINRRDRPTILVVGNAPERKEIYSAGIALITSEMYIQVNQDGRIPCAIVQDEYPTMKPLGFSEVIATGRSRKLAAVAAAQDPSQLERDLGKEAAVADSSIIGNKVFGMMTGPSRKDVSDMFGQHKVRTQSVTTGGSSDTTNTSWHWEKRLPEDRLAGLSNGFFAGIAADGRGDERLKEKYFCAEMLIDESLRPNEKDGSWQEIPPASWDYFNQDRITQIVRDNPDEHCIETLYIDLMLEERALKSADKHYNMYSEYTGREEAKRRYGELSGDDRKDLLERTIERCRQAEVDRILRENMDEIHKDILLLFHKKGIGSGNEQQPTAGHTPAPGGSLLNGAERPVTGRPGDGSFNDTDNPVPTN